MKLRFRRFILTYICCCAEIMGVKSNAIGVKYYYTEIPERKLYGKQSARQDVLSFITRCHLRKPIGLVRCGNIYLYSSDFQVSRHVIIRALGDTSNYNDYSSNYHDYTLVDLLLNKTSTSCRSNEVQEHILLCATMKCAGDFRLQGTKAGMLAVRSRYNLFLSKLSNECQGCPET